VQALPLAPLLDSRSPALAPAQPLRRASAAADVVLSALQLYASALKAGKLFPSFIAGVPIMRLPSVHALAAHRGASKGPPPSVATRHVSRAAAAHFDGARFRVGLSGLLEQAGSSPDPMNKVAIELDMGQAVGALLSFDSVFVLASACVGSR
jgi:hypothetical protein